MVKIAQIFTCIICGEAWDNVQALRGHMKAHKGQYLRTNIYVRRDLWPKFLETCLNHKTTSCHVLDAVCEAIVQGADVGVIDLAKLVAPNPLIINMTHNFLGSPRSVHKVDITKLAAGGIGCPKCGSRKVSQKGPNDEGFLEGSCLVCPAKWLVTTEDI